VEWQIVGLQSRLAIVRSCKGDFLGDQLWGIAEFPIKSILGGGVFGSQLAFVLLEVPPFGFHYALTSSPPEQSVTLASLTVYQILRDNREWNWRVDYPLWWW
jgi:hypothetical protein